VASDESEIESSGEEEDSRRNVKRMKAKDNHEQRQLALGRKKVTSTISINIPNVDTAKGALETKSSKDDQYITIEKLDAHKALSDGMISNSFETSSKCIEY
jgi:hypothetical protein